MIRSKLPFLRENLPERTVIFPRPNFENDDKIFEEDVEGIISVDTVGIIDGLCVPMVNSVGDMQYIEEVLTNMECRFGLESGHFKVIPQIETTEAFVNMKDIFTEGK